MEEKRISGEYGEIVVYQTEDGLTRLDVKFENETVWLTQAQLVELYQTSKSNISEHIKHIFEEGELEKESVVRKFRTTAADGKTYNTTYYNLDMIISLGYRVRSITATHFRKCRENAQADFCHKNSRFLPEARNNPFRWPAAIQQKSVSGIHSWTSLIWRNFSDRIHAWLCNSPYNIFSVKNKNLVLLLLIFFPPAYGNCQASSY